MHAHQRLLRGDTIKFNVRLENRAQWAQEQLSWTYEGGRGYCGLMNPHSPLLALAIDPGLFDRQKSIILGRQSRMVWGGFCGGIKPEPVFVLGKASWIPQPISRLLWKL